MTKRRKPKKKRDPVARKMLANPQYKEKIIPNKKQKLIEKELDKEKDKR